MISPCQTQNSTWCRYSRCSIAKVAYTAPLFWWKSRAMCQIAAGGGAKSERFGDFHDRYSIIWPPNWYKHSFFSDEKKRGLLFRENKKYSYIIQIASIYESHLIWVHKYHPRWLKSHLNARINTTGISDILTGTFLMIHKSWNDLAS